MGKAALPTPAYVYWALPGTLASAALAGLWDLLDDAERRRAERLAWTVDRDAFVLAHAVLRLALSAHAHVAPAAWKFAASPAGKPELAASMREPGLAFSLSHARSIVACVVTRAGPAGIDVEEVPEAVPEAALIERCCTSFERTQLERTAATDVPLAFARLWTMKEAVVKALGAGLAFPLDRVECALDPPRVLRLTDAGEPAVDWEITSLMPTERHVLALARPGAGARRGDVVVRRLAAESLAEGAMSPSP